MNNIKTYEDACEVSKRDPKLLPDVSMLPEAQQKFLIAAFKLDTIVNALNTDQETGKVWVPDWTDWNEYKYIPYFVANEDPKQPGGFAFSHSYYDDWDTYSGVGSRLCFKTRALAEYAGKQFIDVYNDFLQK